jgi:hypothetical protein
MTTRTLHMSIALDYLEEVTREDERAGKPQQFITAEGGRPLSYTEALIHINQLRAEGLDVFPPCRDTDATGRCRGHHE